MIKHKYEKYLKLHPLAKIEQFPAGIDLHVHFREPGMIQKETMATGITAANSGGIFTVIDMPNTMPITDSIDALAQKIRLSENYPGILLAAGFTDNSVNNGILQKLAKQTKILKVFLANSTGNLGISRSNLIMGLKHLSNQKTLIMFHCEDANLIRDRDDNSPELECRPIEAEVKSIKFILELAEEYSEQKFHITHVSSLKGANLLEKQNLVSWDVLAKYLDFSTELVESKGNFAKMNPPLRTKHDVQGLNRLLEQGKIPIVASDHAPHTIEEKQSIIAGAPGVQELYHTLLTRYTRDLLTKEQVISLIYKNPKELLAEVGLKVIQKTLSVDLENKFTVDNQWIKSKSGWSLWEGMQLHGMFLVE